MRGWKEDWRNKREEDSEGSEGASFGARATIGRKRAESNCRRRFFSAVICFKVEFPIMNNSVLNMSAFCLTSILKKKTFSELIFLSLFSNQFLGFFVF